MAHSKVPILVISAKLSESMTCAVKNISSEIVYTAPPDAPPAINDKETSDISAKVTMHSLQSFLDPSYTIPEDVDLHHPCLAYPGSCCSLHPLTSMLREKTDRPVLNIFQASLLQAKTLALVAFRDRNNREVLRGGLHKWSPGRLHQRCQY